MQSAWLYFVLAPAVVVVAIFRVSTHVHVLYLEGGHTNCWQFGSHEPARDLFIYASLGIYTRYLGSPPWGWVGRFSSSESRSDVPDIDSRDRRVAASLRTRMVAVVVVAVVLVESQVCMRGSAPTSGVPRSTAHLLIRALFCWPSIMTCCLEHIRSSESITLCSDAARSRSRVSAVRLLSRSASSLV